MQRARLYKSCRPPITCLSLRVRAHIQPNGNRKRPYIRLRVHVCGTLAMLICWIAHRFVDSLRFGHSVVKQALVRIAEKRSLALVWANNCIDHSGQNIRTIDLHAPLFAQRLWKISVRAFSLTIRLVDEKSRFQLLAKPTTVFQFRRLGHSLEDQKVTDIATE